MKIVFASSNAGKTEELQTFFAPLNITLVSQVELGVTDAEETGLTFIENALIKARHASAHTGLPALADDSGLVVDALQGAPGIYSARYAGSHSNADNNIKKLLIELKEATSRRAYFYCALTFLKSATDPTPIIAEGKWDGEILFEKKGQHGFGYDPIFYIPSENKTAAQLPLPLKNQISHRGQALKIFFESFKQTFNMQ